MGKVEQGGGREESWLLSPGVVVKAIWTSIAAHSANSFQFAVWERRKGTEVKKYEYEEGRDYTSLPMILFGEEIEDEEIKGGT